MEDSYLSTPIVTVIKVKSTAMLFTICIIIFSIQTSFLPLYQPPDYHHHGEQLSAHHYCHCHWAGIHCNVIYLAISIMIILISTSLSPSSLPPIWLSVACWITTQLPLFHCYMAGIHCNAIYYLYHNLFLISISILPLYQPYDYRYHGEYLSVCLTVTVIMLKSTRVMPSTNHYVIIV